MRIWWELRDVYPDAMDEFSRILEGDEDDDEVGFCQDQDLWAKKKKRVDRDEEEAKEEVDKNEGGESGDASKSSKSSSDNEDGTETPQAGVDSSIESRQDEENLTDLQV